jgi:hypothetical protein
MIRQKKLMPSQISTRSQHGLTSQPRSSLCRLGLLGTLVAFFSAGCAHHRNVVLPPVTEAPQPTQPTTIPPVAPSKPTESTPPPTTPAQPPETKAQSQTPPTTTAPPADAPPKVEVAPKKPAAEPPRPPAPQISPQISPSDQAALQNQTNRYLADADKNLHLADGRDLNANQRDMAEKIRGFLGQARDAIKTSDWPRAKNLAQKAYLLSVELANSLR